MCQRAVGPFRKLQTELHFDAPLSFDITSALKVSAEQWQALLCTTVSSVIDMLVDSLHAAS